jgi:hypothetical protein
MDKYILAQNTTDPVILDELSKDKDWWVRFWVSQNPNTLPETLKQMSIVEESNLIKYHIKNHPNCSEETKRYLSALEIIKTLPQVST